MDPIGKFQSDVHADVRALQASYTDYRRALNRVLDHGDEAVEPLIRSMTHKGANASAKALGLLMHSESAGKAFGRLMDWLLGQSPMYPDALEALVRAGDRVLPELIARLRHAAVTEDDEAVRVLLDVGVRRTGPALDRIVDEIVVLLKHRDPEIRDVAAFALQRVGLPSGRRCVPILEQIQLEDESPQVRQAAADALESLR